MTEWTAVAFEVAAVGMAWDRWGVDDGRPKAALLAAFRYHGTPTPEHRAALETALAGARQSWLMASAAATAAVRAGRPPGPEVAAQDAACAVLSLGTALLTTGDEQATHLRTAFDHAGRAARRFLQDQRGRSAG